MIKERSMCVRFDDRERESKSMNGKKEGEKRVGTIEPINYRGVHVIGDVKGEGGQCEELSEKEKLRKEN